MEIFEYAFMQRAFIVGILLAAIIPCIGLVIVCKRLSMIGDALSHTSLAGVDVYKRQQEEHANGSGMEK